MVRLSKEQIEHGIKLYYELAEEKKDTLSIFLVDLLKNKPEGYSFDEISKEVLNNKELTDQLPLNAKGFSLRNEIGERLYDMSNYGIAESQLTVKGKREYSLKHEYFLEGD
jgi:hypothetical protein